MNHEDYMRAIVDEPEFPGEIPEEMFLTIHNLDREGLAEWCRVIVRATKRGIIARIAAKEQESPCPPST